jgi:hypothetical protein
VSGFPVGILCLFCFVSCTHSLSLALSLQIVIGGSCTEVSLGAVPFLKIPEYSIPVITYRAYSPALSVSATYPNLLRSGLLPTGEAQAMYSLLAYHDIYSVGVLCSSCVLVSSRSPFANIYVSVCRRNLALFVHFHGSLTFSRSLIHTTLSFFMRTPFGDFRRGQTTFPVPRFARRSPRSLPPTVSTR